MGNLTTKQLDRLQILSNISLTIGEKEDFLDKLSTVISKLEELGSVDISGIDKYKKLETEKNSLRLLETTFEGEKQKNITANIMKNIKHEIINNSVVIKSVLK